MRRVLLGLVFVACSGSVLAGQGTDASAPTRSVPAGVRALFPAKPDSFVTVRAPFISAGEVAKVNGELHALRASTGAEVALVVLPTIGQYVPEDVARGIGRAWGVSDTGSIGTAHRNLGAVLLVVPKTAQAKGECFLAVADGASGVITDGRAGSLCRDAIEDFKHGKNDEGIDVVLSHVIERMTAKAHEDPAHPLASDGTFQERHPIIFWTLVVIICIVILLVLIYGSDGEGGGGYSGSGNGSSGGFGFGGGGGYSGGGGGGSW